MQELQNTGVDGINDIKIELDDFMAKPARSLSTLPSFIIVQYKNRDAIQSTSAMYGISLCVIRKCGESNFNEYMSFQEKCLMKIRKTYTIII